MVLKKLHYFCVFVSFSILLIFLCSSQRERVFLPYALHSVRSFNFPTRGVCSREHRLIFSIILLFVVRVVSLYSEFYIEHYNNTKFFYILFLFFLSMAIFSLRSSALILILGWDLLGVVSLCLIMFYPNSTTLFNSYITSFYNRVGDALLLIYLALILLSYRFFDLLSDFSLWVFLLLMCCSFTKRAQFPLSRWLPAAMSAPTPISAMVHSSTLVTAGIFLVSSLVWFFQFYNLSIFLFFFRGLTFLAGGLLGSIEMDLKKIVAFSTISQISIVILFFRRVFLIIGYLHIFIHALFKTILFCSCGGFFINHLRDQSLRNLRLKNLPNFFFFLLIFRIFIMRGLPYSSSFYSKDFVLELLISNFFFSTVVILTAGSIFTILYRCKCLNFSIFRLFTSPISLEKKSFFFFIPIFRFLTLLSPRLSNACLFYPSFINVGLIETMFLLFSISAGLLVRVKFRRQFVLKLRFNVFIIKSFLFNRRIRAGELINLLKILGYDKFHLNFLSVRPYFSLNKYQLATKIFFFATLLMSWGVF